MKQCKGLLKAFGNTLNAHMETLNKINESEGVGGNDDISSSDEE